MSPKQSSLAFDEIRDQNHAFQDEDMCYEPTLNLVVNTRAYNSPSQVIKIEGRVTVSF